MRLHEHVGCFREQRVQTAALRTSRNRRRCRGSKPARSKPPRPGAGAEEREGAAEPCLRGPDARALGPALLAPWGELLSGAAWLGVTWERADLPATTFPGASPRRRSGWRPAPRREWGVSG